MNIYQLLNQMIDYIENHLEEEINYKILANILSVNEYTMRSIFSLLSNISLSEYIRKRRLSNAGFDLYHSDEKIIDIAIKYQYDSATSFSRAFEKFHGIKPSEVKKNFDKLKIFAKIVFDETKQIEHDYIQYSIIEMEELTLYGKGVKTDPVKIGEDAPKLYAEINEKLYNKYGSDIPYGMTIYNDDRFSPHEIEYWVLYDVPMEGFEKYVIPKSKWLQFNIPVQDPIEIQNKIDQVYEQFIPSCKYSVRPLPELEYYHDEVTEFLLPIE